MTTRLIGVLGPIPHGQLTCEVIVRPERGHEFRNWKGEIATIIEPAHLCGRAAVHLVEVNGEVLQVCERHPLGVKP